MGRQAGTSSCSSSCGASRSPAPAALHRTLTPASCCAAASRAPELLSAAAAAAAGRTDSKPGGGPAQCTDGSSGVQGLAVALDPLLLDAYGRHHSRAQQLKQHASVTLWRPPRCCCRTVVVAVAGRRVCCGRLRLLLLLVLLVHLVRPAGGRAVLLNRGRTEEDGRAVPLVDTGGGVRQSGGRGRSTGSAMSQMPYRMLSARQIARMVCHSNQGTRRAL